MSSESESAAGVVRGFGGKVDVGPFVTVDSICPGFDLKASSESEDAIAGNLEPDGRTVVDFVGNLDAIGPISSSSDEDCKSGFDRFDGDVRLVNVETGFVPYVGPSLCFTPESNLVPPGEPGV
jgi:hypothetical protein